MTKPRRLARGASAALALAWVVFVVRYANYGSAFLPVGIVGAVLFGALGALLIRPPVVKVFFACFAGFLCLAVYIGSATHRFDDMFDYYGTAGAVTALIAVIMGLGAMISAAFTAAKRP